jgi:hypothetical protein
MTLLRVEGLVVAYRDPAGGERRAVDGVSFTLARGGALGIAWGPPANGLGAPANRQYQKPEESQLPL